MTFYVPPAVQLVLWGHVEKSAPDHAPTPFFETSQANTAQTLMNNSNTCPNITQDEVLKMVSDYERVSKTLKDSKNPCNTTSSRTPPLTRER